MYTREKRPRPTWTESPTRRSDIGTTPLPSTSTVAEAGKHEVSLVLLPRLPDPAPTIGRGRPLLGRPPLLPRPPPPSPLRKTCGRGFCGLVGWHVAKEARKQRVIKDIKVRVGIKVEDIWLRVGGTDILKSLRADRRWLNRMA